MERLSYAALSTDFALSNMNANFVITNISVLQKVNTESTASDLIWVPGSNTMDGKINPNAQFVGHMNKEMQ